ncbi:hypothetical protein ASPWEDRAFT_731661 [Aspergillus wentii DTO 134E9]|uniref:1-alkyl-2-acetylglycerophosphocholine esterase n=1 Tax=Aspergillus wentii DTO 134E9 TaxID=1073089 RepID=A0A1L9S1G3_ASPWE|nr:uncharacterized protein ASPWEDRAFT_731661 [Aspergillus wentii DTO 134E9]OJJ41007.1 hypothetical protein ASPWEDRAFT_731661 [Aspergillus wentii DTO 134E9]
MTLLPSLILCVSLFQVGYSKQYLPPSTGPCNVQITPAELVDLSRVDPFSPDHSKRAIMASSFVPVNCSDESQYSPYVSQKVAAVMDQMLPLVGISFPNVTSKNFMIETKSNGSHPSLPGKEYPVIIFSPGMGASRFIYSSLMQSVASMGFVVISVDHPYDSAIVEFPDGKSINSLGVKKLRENILTALDTRAKDLSFTLDQLEETPKLIPSSFTGRLQLDKVSVIGHSFGGAAAADVMINDTRFAGGMNLDGALWGSVLQQGLDRPFINFGEGKFLHILNKTWSETWPHLRGFRREFKLNGSYHMTFSDLPLLVENAPISLEAKKNATAAVGNVSGLRVRTILSDYIAAASTYFTTGKKSPLLDRSSAEYPEVVIVR